MIRAIHLVTLMLLLMVVSISGAQSEVSPILPTTPITSTGVGQEAQADPSRPKSVELPSSDTREKFSYHISQDNDGVAVIYPADGSSSLYVSTGFLAMVMNDGDLNDSGRLQQLQAFETATAQAKQYFYDDTFPDASKATTPYTSSVLQAGDKDMILEQDPKAGPYVRVTITDKQGKIVEQFSLAKNLADEAMNHPYLTTEQKMEVLGQSANRLPEAARENFGSLTKEAFEAIIAAKPEVARQGFYRLPELAAQARQLEEGRRYKRLSTLANLARPTENNTVTQLPRRMRNQLTRATSSEAIPVGSNASTTVAYPDTIQLRLAVLLLVTGLAIAAYGLKSRKPLPTNG